MLGQLNSNDPSCPRPSVCPPVFVCVFSVLSVYQVYECANWTPGFLGIMCINNGRVGFTFSSLQLLFGVSAFDLKVPPTAVNLEVEESQS